MCSKQEANQFLRICLCAEDACSKQTWPGNFNKNTVLFLAKMKKCVEVVKL